MRPSRIRAAWLVTLAAGAILVPTACVLWFMHEAAAARTAAAVQIVLDAHRGQLRTIRTRLQEQWTARAAALDEQSGTPSAATIETLLDRTAADAVVLLDASGRVTYPTASNASFSDARLRQAHELASAFVAAGLPGAGEDGLRVAHAADVWQLASPDGRVIGLYRDLTVHMTLHRVIDQHQSDAVMFAVFKPGEGAYDEAVALGPAMPGWHASFTLLDVGAVDELAEARAAAYSWVGLLGILLFGAIALAFGQSIRQQLRLARLKSDLVAAVSHELRTPLASMRLLVDALRRDRVLDPGKTREYLDLVAIENGRLSRLIENFLAFSRLERGRLPFTFTDVDPATVVDEAVAAMRERLHPGCDVRIEVEDGLPPVHADAEALVTALLNLLDNAYKYTPADKRIVVRAYREGTAVVFAVEDNGIGIPAAEQRRIFRRFYRVHGEGASGTGGVGLGLSLVQEIARAHGGDVCVTSRPGEGSTFLVRVPASQEAAA